MLTALRPVWNTDWTTEGLTGTINAVCGRASEGTVVGELTISP